MSTQLRGDKQKYSKLRKVGYTKPQKDQIPKLHPELQQQPSHRSKINPKRCR